MQKNELIKKAKELANEKCKEWNVNLDASAAMVAVIEMLAEEGMLIDTKD